MDWFELFCVVCLMIIGLCEVGLGNALTDYSLCGIGGITIGIGMVCIIISNNN